MFRNSGRKAGKKEFELACTLYNQQKDGEAEQLFRQSVQQREKVLGTEHEGTLSSKHGLALTLHHQQKYEEAEQLLRQLILQQEKVLGAEHEGTLDSKELLQEVTLPQASSATSSQLVEAVSSRLGDFFVEGTRRQTAYRESEILQVSRLLRQLNP